MRYARSVRQRRSRWARCGAIAALYMRNLRLTTAAAPTVTITGESTAISCAAMSCAMPEKDSTESATPCSGVIPAEIAATPATKPNGIVPTSTGATARLPAMNSALLRFMHEKNRPSSPRREHVEPGKPLHGMDRRRPHAQGHRGGACRGAVAQVGRIRLRRDVHLRAAACDPHAQPGARGNGPPLAA